MKILLTLSILLLVKSNSFAASIKQITDSVTFASPIAITTAPEKNELLFVVEQGGFVKYFSEKNPNDIKVLLNMTGRIESGGEKGLLGLAFHPKFAQNGIYFINYTSRINNKLKTIVSRMTANPSTLETDLGSEKKLLEIDQPFENHNGGSLAIGPDGFLYIGSGDGGSGGDPFGHGQNRTSLLGKILRIKIDGEATAEIFAIGLRNPWKISFDSQTGDLWAGDVGQNKWEEINIIKQGQNYGWNSIEGNDCFKPSQGCSRVGLTAPLFVYSHDDGDCSITGGHVYRGKSLNALNGNYIYGDFCSGKVWSFNPASKVNTLLFQEDLMISSFGEDKEGDLFYARRK